MSASRTHRIVVIKGDGIGPELVDAALLVLGAAQDAVGFRLELDLREGGAGLYQKSGASLAPGTFEAVKQAGTALKGPVGLPGVRLPDGTEAGLLGGVLRIGLDAYANLRPVRLLPGVESPLKVKAGEIDYVIVRENTEGLYLSRGKGIGTSEAMADTMLVTRKGVERVARYAFELARRRDRAKLVTCVDKANVLASLAFFRRVFDEVGEAYPDVRREHLYADAAAQALVLEPQRFDVLVMENFLGDILSDLGGATVGGIGLCPSGNIGDRHAYFEPIHGSAPDIAGQDKANPISQILSAALLLDHLGERDAANLVRRAVDRALETRKLILGRHGQPEGGTQRAAATLAAAVRELAPGCGW
ncbi:MAG: isocitrate/isopropylmalate dehydrogenase family protein [Burkholderiales bacterium]